MARQFILFLIAIGVIVSCNDREQAKEKESSTPRIRKITKVVLPKSGSSLTIGDSIFFEVESKESIDSVLIDYYAQSNTYFTPKFGWKPLAPRTGNQRIRVQIFYGGESETHYPKIKLISDIEPEQLTYKVVKTLPHDPLAYTQGLFFKDDTLIESTGQNGSSWLSKVNLKTGAAYAKVPLDSKYFGEGSAYWNGHYYQLTWTSQIGFVYDQAFNEIRTFQYTHEGWGMVAWGDTLLVSDGSEVIHFLNPHDLSEIDRREVYLGDQPLKSLNELEIVDGLLYANIYPEDEVAIIEPSTGRVLKIVNLSGLLTSTERRDADALNGIAYDAPAKKLYFTGKLWPKIFEIELTPKTN